VVVNGNSTLLVGGGFGGYTLFPADFGKGLFVEGENVIQFLVSNGGTAANPTGLRVDAVVKAGTGPAKPEFHRGDSNADGMINITDGIFVLNYLFLGGPTPPCLEAANPNDDSALNITDGIYILNFLFLGGPAPTEPGPMDKPCGPDSVGSPKDLGCNLYTKC
jgi:hypothetical protein